MFYRAFRILLWLVAIAAVVMGTSLFVSALEGAEAPRLTPHTAAGGVTVTSDSPRPWKCFLLQPTGDPSTWTVILAEHAAGDDGGLWSYVLKLTPGGAIVLPPDPPRPPDPPEPPGPADDLPLAELRAMRPSGSIPADQLDKLAAIYEALAKQIDSGQIVSPEQLALATQTAHLASFTSSQLNLSKPWRAQVFGWLNRQQAAGRLSAETLPKYAGVYRVLAETLRTAIEVQGKGAEAQRQGTEAQRHRGTK